MNHEVVRVSIPASVAGEINHFKEAVGGILDRLGCQDCCSGHDIQFELQRDLVLKESGDARAEVGAFARLSRKNVPQAMNVKISPKVASNIDEVFKSIDLIAELTGCQACCSGHDLRFNLERQFVLDSKLDIQEQLLSVG